VRFMARISMVGLLGLGFGALVPSHAEQHEEHGHGDMHRAVTPRGEFHGEIGRFHEHDWAVWHSGQWVHGDHGNRHGWWWVVGGIWYFYPAPVYPYPNPYEPPLLGSEAVADSTALPPPPTPTNWYYCESARAYFPYVESCPEGWRSVPASPEAPAR